MERFRKKRPKQFSHGAAVFVMLLILDRATLEAQSYQVSGAFTSKAFSPQYSGGKEPIFILQGTFSVAVQDCRSFAQCQATNIISHSTNFGILPTTCLLAFDGTNFYQTIMVNTNLARLTKKVGPSGRIWSDVVPERADDKLATLWAAFASHCYFKTADPHLIYSPWMGAPNGRQAWTNDHRVVAQWSIFPDALGLPQSIVHTAKFVFEVGADAPVEADTVYSVDTTTNFEGMTFPREFQREFFWPAGKMINSFSGELLSIKAGDPLQAFVPALPKAIYIVDERFITRKGSPVPQYVDNKGAWPSLAEGESHLVATALQKDFQPVVPNGTARVITLITLGLLAIAPALWLIFKPTQKHKNERMTNEA